LVGKLSLLLAHVNLENAQQVSQRDAPPIGGFEIWFLSEVGGFAWLPLAARPLP